MKGGAFFMTAGVIKAIGIGASVLGVGATLISDWVNDIKMEETIEQKVNEAFAKFENKEDNEE